jgi:hypothetical protein
MIKVLLQIYSKDCERTPDIRTLTEVATSFSKGIRYER